MKIQQSSRNSFCGALNNKYLLKGLEKVSEHGTTFAATTSLVMSLGVRPLAIYSTPNVEKENKQYASANSICSGLMKFAVVEAIALPVENAIKKIDANPKKYLSDKTIDTLGNGVSPLANSRKYKFATQILKLGTGFVSAVPKSMLTVALIPIVMDKLFNVQIVKQKIKSESEQLKNKSLAFTGRISEGVPKTLGKILDFDLMQSFVKKHEKDDKNIAKHITAATDVLLTGLSSLQIETSPNIKDNRKKALIYNNIISTGITLTGGYAIDRVIKNKTTKFIEKFSKMNKGDPKLPKYIEGINIVRPALIFATIYYGILPMFSTYLAERVDKYIENKRKA